MKEKCNLKGILKSSESVSSEKVKNIFFLKTIILKINSTQIMTVGHFMFYNKTK